LTDAGRVRQIELRVDQLLRARRHEHLEYVASNVAKGLSLGRDVVLFTSRRYFPGESKEEIFQISTRVAEAIIELIRGLEIRPRFIVVKGSATSTNVATRALSMDRAVILGQLLPGIPVWRLGLESDLPGLIYIPFAGRVGGQNALIEMLEALWGETYPEWR